jgi:predicted acylesterase/phospholipase RssA/CRP-like cAMP-binding protein
MADQNVLRRYVRLTDEDRKNLKIFMRPQKFAAGTAIAQLGRPLQAVYTICSGVVAVSDNAQVDMARRGILLEAGDTFGEYSLVSKIRDGLRLGIAKKASVDTSGVVASMGNDAAGMYLRFLYDDETQPWRPFPSGLRALTDVDTLYLPADQYLAAAAKVGFDKLHQIVAERVFLNMLIPELLEALRRHPDFSGVPPYQLIDLAQRAQLAAMTKGRHLQEMYDSSDGEHSDQALDPQDWVYLARGELRVGEAASLFQGSSFRAVKDEYVAKEDSWVARIAQANLKIFAQHSYPLSAMSWQESQRALGKTVALVTNRPPGRTPLSGLAALLANTLQRELPKSDGKEVVGLLVVAPSDGSDGYAKFAREEASQVQVSVEHGSETDVAGVVTLLKKLRDAGANPIFVDASQKWLEANREDVAIDKVVFFANDSFDPAPEAFEKARIIRCIFLRESKTGSYLAYYPRTIRMAFDNLASLGQRSHVDLSERDRQSLSRCGRAICERRVGVALGGGGAWGFAHVALLRELKEAKVPVDLVSGVSFGSLAGGFLSSCGVAALEEIVDKAVKLQLVLTASSLVPPFVEWYLDALLERKRLEYLEIPFFPVGLNLQTGEEWSPTKGTVAYGIRASSSLPGFFSPVTEPGVRSVDGSYINNVPEGVLTREGADFIIASDVVQVPPPMRQSQSRLWNGLRNLNPLTRLQDSMRAITYTMKVANERDQALADLTFRPGQTGLQPWDFSKADTIRLFSSASAGKFARKALRHWEDRWR